MCCAGITSWLYKATAQDDSSSAAATIPIGCGIHNSRLYVLDPRLQPVPVGVPGQLFISGLQVAAGYLNRKDLTDEVFVPNPFCEGPGTHTERMYRTGDLVRWLPGKHACLEFLGRVDHQVGQHTTAAAFHLTAAAPQLLTSISHARDCQQLHTCLQVLQHGHIVSLICINNQRFSAVQVKLRGFRIELQVRMCP